MFKSILVRCTGADADAPVHQAALSCARRFDAHLTFLHVKLDVRRAIAAMAATDMLGGGWVGDALESMERDAAALEQKAAERFRAFCDAERVTIADAPGRSGVSAEWCVEVGSEPEVIGELGRVADLIVTGRHDAQGAVALDVLQAALLDSGRPVLIVPPGAGEMATESIAIAWKSTPEAARAVTAASPLIERAGRVLVLSVEEESAAAGEAACKRLARSLSWHPAPVETKVLTRESAEPARVLLQAARESGADVLVMGGYAHTRLRELLFGGFTRRVLLDGSLPVSIAH